jgi:hypothetical protein
MRGLQPRRIYQVEPEVLLNPYIANSPVAQELDYPEEYRRELARAHAEVFLLYERSAVQSVMEHRPLRYYRDPARVQRARAVTNLQDPIQLHLNPILQLLGVPFV